MQPPPPCASLTDTLFTYTTLYRSAELSGAMQKINAAVQKRLALAGKREALTRKLTDDHANFLYLAQPAADQAVSDMKSEFGLVAPGMGNRKSTRLNSSH